MSNQEVAAAFLSCYKKHDYAGMQRYLDPNVTFHDMAFDNIRGPDVNAMWHWFCVPHPPRKEPVEVPSFEILGEQAGVVSARYRVQYLYGGKRPVDYVIQASFTVRDGKIVKHRDVSSISQFAFARMALGYPICLLAPTPLFGWLVRSEAGKKLQQFKREQKGLYGSAAG